MITNYNSETAAYTIGIPLSRDRKNGNTIIGSGAAMKELFTRINEYARLEVSVLLKGESGTGKELVAKALHYNGIRRDNRFVAENCAAIPATLIESTFFGAVKGAYTDAKSDTPGKFKAADGGTIFLDEVQEMPIELQAKLLRVLQDKQITPVGSTKSVPVDVRIVAASNSDFEKAVAEKRFREDLYYRLNVLPMTIPPLRERVEDIPLLVNAMIERYNAFFSKSGIKIDGVTKEGLDKLAAHTWPGNVRQLENVIQRAFILARSGVLDSTNIALSDTEFEKLRIQTSVNIESVPPVQSMAKPAVPASKGSTEDSAVSCSTGLWYEREGGITVMTLSSVSRFTAAGVLSYQRLRKAVADGEVYSLSVGGARSSKAIFVTQASLPALFGSSDMNAHETSALYREIEEMIKTSKFGDIAKKPFMITCASMLICHPSVYRTMRDTSRIAREKMRPNDFIDKGFGDDGRRAAFIIREDNAHLFVPRADTPAGIERVEGLKETIRDYYGAFRRKEQIKDMRELFLSGDHTMLRN
jgi:hypothetical protein